MLGILGQSISCCKTSNGMVLILLVFCFRPARSETIAWRAGLPKGLRKSSDKNPSLMASRKKLESTVHAAIFVDGLPFSELIQERNTGTFGSSVLMSKFWIDSCGVLGLSRSQHFAMLEYPL